MKMKTSCYGLLRPAGQRVLAAQTSGFMHRYSCMPLILHCTNGHFLKRTPPLTLTHTHTIGTLAKMETIINSEIRKSDNVANNETKQ